MRDHTTVAFDVSQYVEMMADSMFEDAAEDNGLSEDSRSVLRKTVWIVLKSYFIMSDPILSLVEYHDEHYFVYVLVDPQSWELRYIGCTSNPSERYRNHLSHDISNQTSLRRWLRELRTAGRLPIMIVLESRPTLREARSLERLLIAKYRDQLLNVHHANEDLTPYVELARDEDIAIKLTTDNGNGVRRALQRAASQLMPGDRVRIRFTVDQENPDGTTTVTFWTVSK